MKKQQENLNTLITLMKENPTLEVVPMVHSDVVQEDCYFSWLGKFGTSEIDYIWCGDERIYFKSTDEEELIEKEIEIIGCNEKYKDLSEKQVEFIASANVECLNWKKVIVVGITQP